MKRRCKNILRRVFAMVLLIVLLTVDASAVMREVEVWGARSINDEGQSDNRVTMEELQDDFKDFVQTNGLREYFHKDKENPTKMDLSEALSWLIDNEIINRDETITVSNVIANKVPTVTITKMDVSEMGSKYVMRSDAIMYLYKAVYGPIDARTVGVETDNIRVDDGTTKTLYQMMVDHDYFSTVNQAPDSIVQSESTGGDQQVTQSCVTTPTSHIDTQYVDSQGGTAGKQQVGWAGNINSTSAWRYTPQGDLYDSMFGDTNIFISDVDIAQQGNTGTGTQGIGITTGNSDGASPETNIDITTEGDIYNNGGPTQAGNHNAHQDEWAGTGGLNQAVAIETDYKQIYYVPGADLMFYRTSDVVEQYIRAALSKGLLQEDLSQRTEYFKEQFIDIADPNQLPCWSPYAPAYIVNRTANKLQTAANVATPKKTEDILGVNYKVQWKGNTLTITRQNLFEGVPAGLKESFFKTERIYKMDIYRYIYNFIQGSEKKLSSLETEIVNYKYGMELDGVAKTEEDVEIIKYLIAKGILDFDGTDDFTNLYSPINYTTFCTLLYRTANPEARLDFSLVQLTDSETSWKARGYSPQTLYVVNKPTNGLVQFKINPDLVTEVQPPEDGVEEGFDPSEIQNPSGTRSTRNVSFSSNGSAIYSNSTSKELLATVDTRTIDEELGQKEVALGTVVAGEVEAEINLSSVQLPGGYYMNLEGAAVSTKDSNYSPEKVLQKHIDACKQMTDGSAMAQREMGCYDENNPMLMCGAQFCDNIWVIALLQNNPGSYSKCIELLDKTIEEWTKENENRDPSDILISNVAPHDLPVGVLEKIKSELESTCTSGGTKAPQGVKFKVLDGPGGTVTTWSNACSPSGTNVLNSSSVETVRHLGRLLTGMTYSYTDNNGASQNFEVEFPVGTSYPQGSNLEEVLASYIASELPGKLTQKISTNADGSYVVENRTEFGETVIANMTAETGTAAAQAARANGSKILQFRDGKDGFLAWSQITAYNDSCVNKEDQIPLRRISDLILFNEQTNTYAYFSINEGDKRALVGTSVVTGDSTLGVAFKDGEGASAEYYYHINVIRLLINAKQLTTAFSGLRTFPLEDEKIADAVTMVKLNTSSGHSESSLTAIKALISNDDKKDIVGANGGHAAQNEKTPYSSIPAEGNTRWARFLGLSQSNRAANIIYAKKPYTKPIPGGEGAERYAYAVVVFNPTDLEETGTQQVTAKMSMQDLLDAAVKPPSNAAGLAVYEENKQQCNALANWVYGTSGIEYIKTGYLRPEAYLYYTDEDGTDGMPASIWDNSGKYSNIIQVKQMKLFDGALCPPSVKALSQNESGVTEIDSKYRIRYYLSSDYRAIVAGERLYFNEFCFPNLHYDAEKSVYTMTNTTARCAQFTIGGTFELKGTREHSKDWVKALRATVLETKEDGTIRCQYGPIPGIPVKNGTGLLIVTPDSSLSSSGRPVTTWDWKDTNINNLAQAKVFMGNYGANNLLGKIVAIPHVLLSDTAKLINTGDAIKIYSNASSSGQKTQGAIPVVNLSGNSTLTFRQVKEKLDGFMKKQSVPSSVGLDSTSTYLEFTFSADSYTVKDGVLTYSAACASDFLSPALFTNLNDMIIDEMMNVSNGAIPVNDIPTGCLLKVGTGYYCATGADPATKTFVGYSHLDISTGVFKPQVQDAAKSFANHFIRGGNDYINVSHYFKEFHLIPDANFDAELDGPSSAQQTSLNIVANSTLASDGEAKVVIYPNGDTAPMGSATEGAAKVYTPCSISFQDILLAYPSQVFTVNGGEVQAYTLCSNAVNAAAGDFADLPFFTNSILEASLTDITGANASASYTAFSGDLQLMAALRREFQKAFAGDLYTLIRLILFCILVWLFVASWLCFGFYYGNLMPIVDAIKYPSRDRGVKGIDLFKLMSFGTISVDTDFKLGRFIQYDAIIAILICIVWKSGSLGF